MAAWRMAAQLSGSAWKAISAAPGSKCKFVVTVSTWLRYGPSEHSGTPDPRTCPTALGVECAAHLASDVVGIVSQEEG